MKLATEEITTMQALEAHASEGEWHCIRQGEEPSYDVFSSIEAGSRYICEMTYAADNAKADGDFIAAARTFVPRAIEHIRFTEASTEEALLLLDEALNTPDMSNWDIIQLIDMAAQKLRPEPTQVHDAEALVALTQHHLAELPWMQAAPGANACDETCWCRTPASSKAANLTREAATEVFSRSRYAAGVDPERVCVRDVMVLEALPAYEDEPATEAQTQIQATVKGMTDWYRVGFDDAGRPDPATIEKLPF